MRYLLGAALVAGGAVYAFILVLDPYQVVPFSPPFDRAPISTNQRFAYPALARDPAFDSAIIGTSTVRLLDPESLNAHLGARFVNLAMNSATAYEQARMHDLFVRHHPDLRFLVIGVDETWCNRRVNVPRYTFRAFPEWMFDDNPYNDLLYLFNDKALENAVRMLELLVGAREPKYRRDGYRDFTADFEARTGTALTQRLYGGPPRVLEDFPVPASRTQPAWHYPSLKRLLAMLEATPRNARVVLFFPPLHAHYVQSRAGNLAECKGRIAGLIANFDNVRVLDFLYGSELTREDANFWDALHFVRGVANMLEADIARVLHGDVPNSPFAREFAAVVPGSGH